MSESAAERYTSEQDKLRRKESLEDTDDLHIEIPQAPQVNPELYRDVEPLVFRGFLHVPALINGVRFVFKSLNHHEFELLNFDAETASIGHKELSKFYSTFLAYGVFMVDGVNILKSRDTWIPQLVETFEALDDAVRTKIVRNMSEINRRANRAVLLSEAYCFESFSRLRWAQLKDIDLTSTAVTGIEGTAGLGMNWGQLTWRALNYFEDLRNQSEREWENAKFIASAMAGKGMSKVHSQDKQRRKREMEERLERRDKILRFAVLGEPLDSPKDHLPVKVARTVEELQTQLEHDLKGEKDWHDSVVEEYEQRVRDSYLERQRHLLELQKSFEERYGGRQVVSDTSLEGLTLEQVNRRTTQHRQQVAQRLAGPMAFPELQDPKVAGLLEKYITSSSRDPAEVPPVVVSNRPRGVPFGRGR